MLQTFDEETESGKLYLSYPMAEAIKETLTDNFQTRTVPISASRKYKESINTSSPFTDLLRLSGQTWQEITTSHLNKGCFLVGDNSPSDKIFPGQKDLFTKQLCHHINPHGRVATLSGFPFFIGEYFGSNIEWNRLFERIG
jgi:hypothetical protein